MGHLTLPPGEKGDIAYQAQSLIYSIDYRHKLMLVRQAVESCAECQCKVSGIGYNQAKTGSYWAAATYRQYEKKVSPVLLYVGGTSTGKSQNEKKVRDYCCNSSDLINAKIQTFATVRDNVLRAIQDGATTIIIEESDRNKYSEDLEEFIYSSYDRITSKGIINRPKSGKNEQGFDPVPYDNYAAFMEHRRTDPVDAANARRAIVLETHKIKDAKFPMADDIPSPNTDKMRLVTDIVLLPLDRPDGIEGGVWNNWGMLIQIASALQDHEWINWAIERMKQDSELLQDVRSYDPQVVAFNSLQANLEKTTDGSKIKTVKLSRIVDAARREHGKNISHQSVSQILKRLGIPHGKSDGSVVFKPTYESLEKAAINLGEDTDFLNDIRKEGDRRE